jgi:glycerate kinase
VGLLAAIEEAGGLEGVTLVGGCDVDTRFVGAAEGFARQKGATEAEVAELAARLQAVADRLGVRFGIDVTSVPGSGAAGGMGGAIVALGGTLRSGYRVVSEICGLPDVLDTASMVITGEGSFDATSLPEGPPPGRRGVDRVVHDRPFAKVTGSVLRDASARGIPSLVVAGRVARDMAERASALGAVVVSLTEEFGPDRATADTSWCIEEAVAGALGTGLRAT